MVGRDDLTHHNAVVPQRMVQRFLCVLGREDQHPVAAWLRGGPQGLGQTPPLCWIWGWDTWLGLVDSSNPIAKPDDVPLLCVRPPSLEQFWLLSGL